MSIREQQAKSTAGITGVTGEHPSGSGTPMPQTGGNYQMSSNKKSKLSMVGHQSLDATRPDRQKHTGAPMGDQGMKVNQFFKGAPKSVMHVKAPSGAPVPNSSMPSGGA